MPYILNKTNGTKLITLNDASLDRTTSLTFVGRNYAGYGEVVNENFIKLLENFANVTQPNNPLAGQFWFDSSNSIKKIKVYDGKNFKSVANIHVDTSSPSSSLTGDLWWDSNTDQLKVFNGSTYKIIGPQESARSSWIPGEETTSTSVTVPILKGNIGFNTIATVSKETFPLDQLSSLYLDFDIIKAGITLAGADPVTGSSTSTGYYFWGTAAESLSAKVSDQLKTVDAENTNSNYYVTLVSAATGINQVKTDDGITYNPSTNILGTTGLTAVYADLAERYETDHVYDVGTVVVIGGTKEITVTHEHADTTIAGVISKDPAYMMNSNAGPNDTHPYVALRGRVLCKVIGPVKKGQLLVSSSYPGYAEVYRSGDNANAVIGKALKEFKGPKGLIEILV